MSDAKTIVKKSTIYAVGNIIRGVASFVMLPIYTRYLSPNDYGVIELISVALDLALLLLGARVAVGIFKFYSDAESKLGRSQVIGTALCLMGGAHLLAVLAIIALSKPLALMLNATPDFRIALITYSTSAIFSALNEVFFSFLKIRDRAIAYVGVNFFKLIIQLSLNIYLIVYLNMKYWGVVWSAVISAAVVTLVFGVWLLPEISPKFSSAHAKQLVRFSGPIILASLAMYYIMFSSRYYLEYFWGVATVGIYAVANKFGMMVFTLVASPFSEYWTARQFEMAKSSNAASLFGNVFFYLNLVLLIASAGLIALSSDVVHLMAASAYWTSSSVIPWLVGAYFLQAWGDYFRFGCFYTENNRYITYASFATVVFVTAFYFLLIPRYGAIGAAASLFAANVVRVTVIVYYGQSLFRMTVPWGRICWAIGYFSALVFLVKLVPGDAISAVAVRGAVMTVGCIAVLFTPLIDQQHREFVAGLLNSRVARLLRN